ncbi:hypothetical protein ACYOEI_28930 [Singulisphaera rosea]
MSLLDSAHDAGLAVRVEGSRVVVRGPRSAEGLARKVLSRKAEILAWWNDLPPPSPTPWRATIAEWPIPLRERWGRRANQLEDEGHDWREAERLAFEEIASTSHEPGEPR